MPPAKAPNLREPIGPLALELKRGCLDDAVLDGVGAYVANWARAASLAARPDLARRLSRIADAFDAYAGLSHALLLGIGNCRPSSRTVRCGFAVRRRVSRSSASSPLSR